MTRTITIDPVTRIEGHAKVTIHLDDRGQVADARFHVAEFRGFEKFCEGRPFWEMPALTSRVCGICPVSHLLASAKAGDSILGVAVPPSASKLRRLINLAQIVQSHALSVFHMSAPDLLLGFDSDPLNRNLFGLLASEPELARGGIRLRQFGQAIIEALGGRKIHPSWAVPGGVKSHLSRESAQLIQSQLPELRRFVRGVLDRLKAMLDSFAKEVASFGSFPSLFVGLVGPGRAWEHYDGLVRVVDEFGRVAAEFESGRFEEYLGETVQNDSYLKSPYFKPLGFPQGMYRVGPLARLNICDRIGSPLGDVELAEFRDRAGRPAHSSFHFHYARMVEILIALEKTEEMLGDEDLYSGRLQVEAGVNNLSGFGCSEAPRGTLFHHYTVDGDGVLQKVNLVIATGQNNLAMNRTIQQIAREYVADGAFTEGALNRVEAGIRAYDPCLSCSTHALGQMALRLQLLDAAGRVIDERSRA
ncbi:MAG: Ni/Fe hydrogenase subunit alpha [Gemmataceae bacterium]|nr:Ni/Fe hydrogenase subunit alpha [Gemmataceae bacterium]